MMEPDLKHGEGIVPSGQTKILHMVPRDEVHETGHAGDCYCEPLAMIRFHGQSGGKMIVFVHRHDYFHIVEEGTPSG